MGMETVSFVDESIGVRPVHHERQILDKSSISQDDVLELVTVCDDGKERIELVRVVVTGQKLRFGQFAGSQNSGRVPGHETSPYRVHSDYLVVEILDGDRRGQIHDGRWDHVGIEPVYPNSRDPYFWEGAGGVPQVADHANAHWLDTGVYFRTPVSADAPA